jgi:aerobic-type carbon monoxide dehydrogenase small subunit (CoxS/CutS family)
MMDIRTTLNVNGEPREVQADGETKLLEVLRDDLGLTGTKYGCGESQCGACTVLIDGSPVKSCITALSSVGQKPIQTIESLAKNGKLHPVQQAFIDAGAMQCGYCTPGMIMTAVHLLRTNPNPTERQIVQALQGNICRCCAYPQIVDAVKRAADAMRQST